LIPALVAQGAHAGPRKACLGNFVESLPESFRFVWLRLYLPASGRGSVQLAPNYSGEGRAEHDAAGMP
jgi:hypothetical protein